MRFGLFALLLVSPIALAQPLAPPRIEVEVEQATWPSRTRPVPVPNCPPVPQVNPAVPAVPPTSTPPNPNELPKLPTQEELARQTPAADSSPFAQGTEGGGNSARTFNDNFNGDFGGVSVTERRQVGTVQRTYFNLAQESFVTVDDPVYQNFTTILGSRYNGILITDNDSPRPTDRAYFGFNYYNGINPNTNTGPDSIDMYRQTIGFEKTFLQGRASFGMRLPFIQTYGPRSGSSSNSSAFTIDGGGNVIPVPGFAGASSSLGGQQVERNVGDLSFLLKYAFFDDRTTGNLMSLGMVITTPIGGGDNITLSDGTAVPNSVLLQPWLGGVRVFSRGYTQAISSFLVPTSSNEPTLANNSVSAGYFLYSNTADRFVNGIVPVIEVHTRTPLTYRDPKGQIFLQDQLNLTFGVHFRTVNATISPSFTVPTVGPNPFRYEAALWVNFRF